MNIEIKNKDFYIRVVNEVAYFKPIGFQDEAAANFLDKTIDDVITQFPHEKFATLSDLSDLILASPKIALEINKSIKKITTMVDYRFNAIIIKPRFLEIIKGFVFNFYLRNICIKSQIFYNMEDAIEWLSSCGFEMEELKNTLIFNKHLESYSKKKELFN